MQSDLHSSPNPPSADATTRVLYIARSGQCSGCEAAGSEKDETKQSPSLTASVWFFCVSKSPSCRKILNRQVGAPCVNDMHPAGMGVIVREHGGVHGWLSEERHGKHQ